MKKNNFILWIAAFIITFLTLYFANLFSEEYPITGTIGIAGKKISYRFERVHYNNDNLNIIIRSDIDSVKGNIFWKEISFNDIWNIVELKDSTSVLTGVIPNQKPSKKIEYYVELNYRDKKFYLPDHKKVSLIFYGKISPALKAIEFMLLYLGLFLGIRTAIEYFNNSTKSKKLSIMTTIVFITLTLLINPLYLTYKLGYMNNSIPEITKLFPAGYYSITLIWIFTTILLFRKPEWKIASIISGIISIAIFIFLL